MATTVKELHVEIEQRIQQITSNRRRSIAPEFIDMCLNTTVVAMIDDKLSNKTNYKREGFEESKERTDEFQSIKRVANFKVLYESEDYSKGFIILPSDYYRLIASNSNLRWSKLDKESLHNTSITTNNISLLDIDSLVGFITESNNTGFITIDGKKIDLDNILKLYYKNKDIFTFISPLIDVIRINGFEAYWEFYDTLYLPHTLIISNVGYTPLQISLTINNQDVISQVVSTRAFEYNVENINVNKHSENDLIPSENILNIFNNYYSNIRRYNNPISELRNRRLYVYNNIDFKIDSVDLTYIKKPILFNINTNQFSDFEVTPELIDKTVSLILLTLKDGTYQNVQQFNQE